MCLPAGVVDRADGGAEHHGVEPAAVGAKATYDLSRTQEASKVSFLKSRMHCVGGAADHHGARAAAADTTTCQQHILGTQAH